MVHQLNREYGMGNATNQGSESLAEQHLDLDWARSVLRGRRVEQDNQGAAINMLQRLTHYGCTEVIRRLAGTTLSTRHTKT
jgi:hypothetical protein